ncbi:uncharacterized protein STEHIDRAFT_163864 [Stereum hirsutum FP-91666 SS1]|uniref:Uncharacterized protein n=1 Tax=Stereum hirsutum (strain FP-91666) TaxID=721885 RepID=R7RXW2_STEHR|nr:uncharacterized protein STEHIDRAFT_163864 [Stereum hirsutum FP-91666 SS1]EIM79197.1 hypothetical protein STEHIDRAFT_163864 [Stereum hirsutum FP-91666 SS1]
MGSNEQHEYGLSSPVNTWRETTYTSSIASTDSEVSFTLSTPLLKTRFALAYSGFVSQVLHTTATNGHD